MNKKKLPVNISNFRELIEENYLYIDKTESIYNLINLSKNYFICRPRRFGKSLLVSTFESLFLGQKALFKGLWIYDKYDFKKHPVIKLDFSAIEASCASEFRQGLDETVTKLASSFGLDISGFSTLNGRFRQLIRELNKTSGSVVILVDEYDDPIIKNINNLTVANEIRGLLIEFFKVVKSENEFLKFVFVTGITKFSKETIFSGMNNLFDLSLSIHAKTLFGYTELELDYYFKDYIKLMAQKYGTVDENIKNSIKNWYNGYRFSIEDVRVYNPQSILNYFFEQDLRNYWLATATSGLVLDTIKKNNSVFNSLLKNKFALENFTTLDIDNISDAALFFQTGYITIANYNSELKYFEFAFPNQEVEESASFMKSKKNFEIEWIAKELNL